MAICPGDFWVEILLLSAVNYADTAGIATAIFKRLSPPKEHPGLTLFPI